MATSEELSFFDRAKKVIGNKNTMNEFLKLCNLFSQDLIDRTTLVTRARSFIGGNPDLYKWFQEWVGYDEKDILIENRAKIPSGRISLSNCRGLGPSYRLLPKRVSSLLLLLCYCYFVPATLQVKGIKVLFCPQLVFLLPLALLFRAPLSAPLYPFVYHILYHHGPYPQFPEASWFSFREDPYRVG